MRLASTILIGAVMAVLLLAGMAKFLDLPSFGSSLAAWELLPRRAILPLAVLVPTLELAIAGAWLLGLERRWSLAAAWALLAAFTVAYGAHAALARPPRCACFGRLLMFDVVARDAWFILARNGAMLMALLAGMALSRRPGATAPRDGGASKPSTLRVHAARGFTLIEALLTIALVGVLIATLAPSLVGARNAATRSATLALLRTHVGVFQAYTADWKDVYPYFTDPLATRTIIRCGHRAVQLPYFAASLVWPWAMADHGYDGECRHRSFRPPGDLDSGWAWTPFAYSSTCIAEPRFWNPRTRTGPEQWVPVRADQVLYPAKKGLFINMLHVVRTIPPSIPGSQYVPPGPLPPDRGVEIGFCDGSAASWRFDRLSRPYPGGEGDWEGSSSQAGFPVRHTIDGVRGRDTP